MVSKLTVPTLLSKFKFAFEEGVDREAAPYLHNHMIVTRPLPFSAKVSHRGLTYSVE